MFELPPSKPDRARKRRLKHLLWLTGATVAALALTPGLPGTLSHFITHARTLASVPETASAQDILDIGGAFNEQTWLATGASGIVITNKAHSRIWVYFSIEGTLRDVLQHINPVALEPGQSYELHLPIVDPTELGLLGWRNEERQFSGTITARVLNDYASYSVAEMTVHADRLFACLVESAEDPELEEIRTVQDVAGVIILRNKLRQENLVLENTIRLLRDQIENLFSQLPGNSQQDGGQNDGNPGDGGNGQDDGGGSQDGNGGRDGGSSGKEADGGQQGPDVNGGDREPDNPEGPGADPESGPGP